MRIRQWEGAKQYTGILHRGAIAAMFALAAQAGVAEPEESGSIAQAAVLEEITVTARRVGENLQAVPIAITAATNEDIRDFDIRSVTDLQRIVPSLTATGRLGQNEESLTLRGQRATGEFIGAGAGPAVVSYFAEVPSATTGPGLYLDLANVQVLKGPQGTLFGRNTTGGAVLYEPQRPENGFAGYAQGTVGDLDRFDVEGVINVPIVNDVLLVRIAAQRQRRDGLAVDVNTGTEYNNRKNWTARIGVQFNPHERVSNYSVFQSVNFSENGPATILYAVNPAAPVYPLLQPLFAAQQQRGIRKVAFGVDGPEKRDTDLFLNRTEFDLGGEFAITNIFSYTREKANRSADLDGTILPLNDSLGITGHGDGANPNHSILTEELQLSGLYLDGSLEWRIGGYLERLRTEGAQTFSQRLSLFVTTHQLDAPQSIDSEALFGHANLDLGSVSPLLEGLNLSAGYRYTWDAGSLGFDLLIYPGQLFELDEIPAPQPGDFCFTGAQYPNCFVEVDSSDSGQSWNLGLDYRVGEDLLAYLSYRRGYKSGGFNPGIGVFFGTAVEEFAFGPEKVDALELGLKSDWSLGEIAGRTNLAIYKSWYNDVQVLNNVIVGVAATTATQNAAKATIQGIEVEGEVRLTAQFRMTYGYAYTDADYVDYVTPSGEDLGGLPFLYTPEHMVSLGLALDLALPSDLGMVTVFANHSWQDDMFAGFTTAVTPGVDIPSYGLTNLRLTWSEILGTGMELAIFVNNLSDKEYRIANNPHYGSLGYALTQYGEPRCWGASLRMSF
ncbi:MAG: TonB-dependent receptor [Gammaproteobacteria bacterium]|nr:TonB-dependent receptor [Gammaproteobacteria bacterium]